MVVEREVWDNIVCLALESFQEILVLRLPDEKFVKIMTLVDLDDLLRLRHTCRTFMRLFAIERCFY